jgi:beta-lactamase class A
MGMGDVRRPQPSVRTADRPSKAKSKSRATKAVELVAAGPALEPVVAAKTVAVEAVPAAVPAPVIPEMQPDAALAAEQSRRTRSVSWRRPAMAVGFAATVLMVSVVAVRILSAHNSTASADTAVAQATSAPSAAPKPHKSGLQPLLNNFAASGGSNFAIVVKDLRTGETAAVNPDQQMESASLYKLFVAQRIYQQIDLGQLKLSQDAGAGDGQTIGQCLTVMINISDNDCGRALGDILNWGAQDQALDTEGYTNTDLASPQQTSANDVAKLLERLYRGTLLSPDSTNRFLSLLKDQKVNNRLPTGLPDGTVIAHKTGDLDGFSHDAGIVYGPRSNYLVVVMSGPWSAVGDAPASFTTLSQQLWNYFEQ